MSQLMALALNPSLSSEEFTKLSQEVLESRYRIADQLTKSSQELYQSLDHLSKYERATITLGFMVQMLPLVLR